MPVGSRLRIAALAALGLASWASADNIDVTFNNLSAGALAGQTDSNGNVWTSKSGGTSVVGVVSGDLTAPAATHYAPAQGGTPQSVTSPNGSTSSSAGAYLSLATPLTGTIWFSFLAQPSGDGNSRDGIGINGAGSMGAGYRILSVGSGLYNSTSNSVSGTAFTLGSGNLVVGELLTGTKQLKLWVNPDVSTFQASTPTPNYDSGTGAFVPASVTDLMPIAYQSGGSATGSVDNIVFSNDANAESQVLTGVVPEPATLGLMSVLAGGLLVRRRRGAARPV